MQIIVVSDRLARARTVTLTTRHIILGAVTMALMVLTLSGSLLYVTIRHAAEVKLPMVESLVLLAQEHQSRKAEDFLRENLNTMAVKLGTMQAQLTRLDALGQRLSGFAGLKPQEFRFNEIPGRGGAIATSVPPHNLSISELGQELDALNRQMENGTDYLAILESTLFDARVKRKLMPTIRPVEGTWLASSFGWRIDPFNGQHAMHEGIDFISDVGTPIFAAAGGVVVASVLHHQYGNMIEIDHGNDFTTRYGHASRLYAKVGDVVQRGRKIAEVGSTGRSTGPHLHFEVRYKGAAQNPSRFLQASR